MLSKLFNFMCFLGVDMEEKDLKIPQSFLFILQGKLELVAKHSMLI